MRKLRPRGHPSSRAGKSQSWDSNPSYRWVFVKSGYRNLHTVVMNTLRIRTGRTIEKRAELKDWKDAAHKIFFLLSENCTSSTGLKIYRTMHTLYSKCKAFQCGWSSRFLPGILPSDDANNHIVSQTESLSIWQTLSPVITHWRRFTCRYTRMCGQTESVSVVKTMGNYLKIKMRNKPGDVSQIWGPLNCFWP